MKVNRNKLVTHLTRLHCNGVIPEVVLDGNFQAYAINSDQQLFVRTGGLDKVEDLGEPVGVLNLNLLIRALLAFGEDDNEDISFTMEDHRIVLSEKGRGDLTLITTSPRMVSTSVEDETADAIEAEMVGDDEGIAFPQATVEAILKTARLLKAEVIRIERNTKGTNFIVGHSTADYAKIPLPMAKLKKGTKSYELALHAEYVVAVLGQLSDFTATQIGFSGVDSLVRVWDDEFSYVLSPMEDDE